MFIRFIHHHKTGAWWASEGFVECVFTFRYRDEQKVVFVDFRLDHELNIKNIKVLSYGGSDYFY